MWLKESNKYFCMIENFPDGEIKNRALVTWTPDFTSNVQYNPSKHFFTSNCHPHSGAESILDRKRSQRNSIRKRWNLLLWETSFSLVRCVAYTTVTLDYVMLCYEIAHKYYRNGDNRNYDKINEAIKQPMLSGIFTWRMSSLRLGKYVRGFRWTR